MSGAVVGIVSFSGEGDSKIAIEQFWALPQNEADDLIGTMTDLYGPPHEGIASAASLQEAATLSPLTLIEPVTE